MDVIIDLYCSLYGASKIEQSIELELELEA